MKKLTLASLVFLTLLSSSYSQDTVDWDNSMTQIHQKEFEIQQQAKLITKIDILMAEATTIANDTIRSLKSNLNFLTKIRTDSTFRNCAIQKDNLSKMNILKDSAKELFDDREITRTQYHNYIKKLKSEMQNLNNTIHKTCKNEG